MNHLVKLVALQLLRAYKWAISPLFPPACRYVPTCSEYAMEAIERYGAFRGSFMAVARLLRCHPFAGGGYDPVVSPQHICTERPATSNQRTNDQPTNDQPTKDQLTNLQLTNLQRPSTPASFHGAI